MRPYLVAYLDRLLGAGLGEILAPTYVVMLCIAMLSGAALAMAIAKAAGFDKRRAARALLGAWLGAMVGARLFTVFVNVPEMYATGNPAALLRGGFAAYGGFLGGALGGWIGLGRRDFLLFGDIVAPTLGLGTALTRVGCYLAGCDYGVVTRQTWGARFPPGSPAFQAHLADGWVGPYSPSSLPVHPTELYEAALGALICVVCLVLIRARQRSLGDGAAFMTAAGLYAIGRTAIESVRGDADRGIAILFSTSQIVSAMVLVGVAAYVARRLMPDPLAVGGDGEGGSGDSGSGDG
jgi:phosphatidylglycerol:prolipoprotein diacylglycerol transferase